MKKTINKLLERGVILTDGSWGTQFQRMGLLVSEYPDFLNITNPELVEGVARSYVEAGSQVILTNTFRSNRIALGNYGGSDKVIQLNKAGVELSKKAAGDKVLVFASIGPSGKILMMEEISEKELILAFEEQSFALADAGADALLLETFSDLSEAVIALNAVKKTRLPVAVSMVFDSGQEKNHTIMGNSIVQAAKELSESGADIIGANCGQGIEGFLSVCKNMRAATELPLWMKPNAGLPHLANNQIVYSIRPKEFASYVPALIDAGANFIGGCCGTDPSFIVEINISLRSI